MSSLSVSQSPVKPALSSRFIVEMTRPGHPQVYYLSRSGFRCYTAKNVGIMRTLADAQEQRDHFAKEMPEFRLAVAQLPRGPVDAAILRSVPVAEGGAL